MRIAISKQGRSVAIAAALAVAGVLTGSAQASVISSSPTFPPIPLSFASPTGAGCFNVGVCVTPGIFTLNSAVSTFLPAGQDVLADATYTGSLTTLPTATPPNVFLGSFTLTGTVELEVLGRTSPTETGSWTTELTGMSLSGPLLTFGTLSATLDPSNASTGTTSITPLDQTESGPFVINSFFDIFVDLTLDRPLGPPLCTTVGPIRVVAVPEASTWAMLLIGFAGPGFAGWRRGAGSAG